MIDLKNGSIYSDDNILLAFKGIQKKDLEMLYRIYPHHESNTFVTLQNVKFMSRICTISYLITTDNTSDISIRFTKNIYNHVKSLYDISKEMLKKIHEIDCKIVNDITGTPTESVYNWGSINPIYNTRSWDSYILIRYNK
ncbi:hypothetical protein KHQ81_06220 [Mycoplasmatota bacterium]|nr:hypothetical protein KHQ81_06220 [Mycoplasmatota bacterium]